MSDTERPIGKQYRHIYQERAAPSADSEAFRRRLHHFLTNDDGLGFRATKELIVREFGLNVSNVESTFVTMPVATLLSLVTAAAADFVDRASRNHNLRDLYVRQRVSFLRFVDRAFREENLSYELDEYGGVHPLIDAEFQHNRRSALVVLGEARYVNVAKSAASAFDRITVTDADTKAAVRDIFDAAESIFKLIIAPTQSNLTEQTADTLLRPVVNRTYATLHPSTQQAAGRVCSSFGKWADACHPYRHGQAADHIVAPPIGLTVVLLSQGASFLRWLVEVDPLTPAPRSAGQK
jgi:hypothetical protein